MGNGQWCEVWDVGVKSIVIARTTKEDEAIRFLPYDRWSRLLRRSSSQ